jgi:predicted amidohydrolase
MKTSTSNFASRAIHVAAIQYKAIPNNKDINLQALEQQIIQAAQAGARLVVLPEMCTTGLVIGNRKDAANLAEPVPGPSTKRFAELAARNGIFLVFGLPTHDRSAPRFHNSQVLLSSTGQILARYDKRHLYGPDWDWAEPGTNDYQAVDTSLGRIALGICYDINFADLTDFLFSQQVDILAFSTNWVEDRSPLPFWEATVRGSRTFFVAANNWGDAPFISFSGESAIISPDCGVLMQSAPTGNSVVIADISWPISAKSLNLQEP